MTKEELKTNGKLLDEMIEQQTEMNSYLMAMAKEMTDSKTHTECAKIIMKFLKATADLIHLEADLIKRTYEND
jgi:hypothetical protein